MPINLIDGLGQCDLVKLAISDSTAVTREGEGDTHDASALEVEGGVDRHLAEAIELCDDVAADSEEAERLSGGPVSSQPADQTTQSMGVALVAGNGPPSEVAHGVAAVLMQDGVRPLLLGHPVDHHQDQGVPIGELSPRLLDLVEVISQAQIEPGQKPADTRSTNRLVEVGHIL